MFESLPVAVVASPGAVIGLDAILQQNFGPGLAGLGGVWLAYLVPGEVGQTGRYFSYWDPNHPVVTRWLVNGQDIGAGPEFRYVAAPDLAKVQLQAGNHIGDFTYVAINAGSSETPVFIEFSIVVLDPAVAGAGLTRGRASPAEIVARARRFNDRYGGVANTEDCGYIVNAVAAAAAGAMQNQDVTQNIDPAQNRFGGFWRVVYRGSDQNPVSRWHTLLQPGDIVHMGWRAGGEHTTLILGVDAGGVMTAFDNGGGVIGIHRAQYDLATIATTVTILRLSPDHVYLVPGAGQGDRLPGNLYDDLFVPNGPNGTVAPQPHRRHRRQPRRHDADRAQSRRHDRRDRPAGGEGRRQLRSGGRRADD